jgi:hypothetical protein
MIFMVEIHPKIKSMKQLSNLPILAAAIIVNAYACTKTNSQQTLTVTVKEYKTNLPIQGAKIDFYRRGTFDFWTCGCYTNELFSEQYSDARGTCSAILPAGSSPLNEITFDKPGYYSMPVQTGENLVEAYGWLRYHLVPANIYKTQIVTIHLTSELNSTANPDISLTYPMDSVYQVNAFGGQINTITWTVNDSTGTRIYAGGPLKLEVGKTDTADVEINF